MKTKKEMKLKAQDILMDVLSISGYSLERDEFNNMTDEEKEELRKEMLKQMNRIAKIFGFEGAWFS